MTEAQTAVPARGQPVVHRFAVRMLLVLGLAVGAWLIGALLAGTASAATTPDPPASTDGPQTETDPARPGLLGSVLGTVDHTLSKPVKTALQPVHEILDPAPASGAGDQVGTLPSAPQPKRHHTSIPPTTPSAGEAETRAPAAARLAPAETISRPARPENSRRPAAERPSGDRAAHTTTAPQPCDAAAPANDLGTALQTGDNTTCDHDWQPQAPAPASPAPAAPSSASGATHGNPGGEREFVCLLPPLGSDHEGIGIAAASGQHPHRVPAARGLPAVSPD
ncbi:MAG: hypothetical protein ACRDQ5_01245 [Sciscionella sp.]